MGQKMCHCLHFKINIPFSLKGLSVDHFKSRMDHLVVYGPPVESLWPTAISTFRSTSIKRHNILFFSSIKLLIDCGKSKLALFKSEDIFE